MDPKELLTTPIADLPVSSSFYRKCTAMGFGCLQDVVAIPMLELVDRPGFSYRWFSTVIKFLKKDGLAEAIQSGRGKKSG